MACVPVLMILYTSDAVEIRYSDGSRLELSPCGSTMIHHPSLLPSEHPRQAVSNTVHKRTMFVTSEHRSKVLQALDFRNRFAERPYLIKELLPKDDLVALYSKIDQVAWPKAQEMANVEILSDGSRRITSLDEYASLIVSPHGHEFTVCYLSQISREQKRNKDNFSYSTSIPVHPSLSTTKASSSDSYREVPPQKVLRPKEAIVHPFEACRYPSTDMNVKDNNNRKANPSPPRLDNTSIQAGMKGITLDPHEPFKLSEVHHQECPAVKSTISDSKVDKLENDVVIQDKSLEYPECSYRNLESVRSQEACAVKHFDACGETHSNMESPTAQELSSISRSSTPDGLRMTIDSEATLIHDNTFGSQRCPAAHKPGKSGLAQFTSSPNEDIIIQLKKKKITDCGSLNGSFIENYPQARTNERAHPVEPVQDVPESFSATLKNDSTESLEHQNTVKQNDSQCAPQRFDFDADIEPQSLLAPGRSEHDATGTQNVLPDSLHELRTPELVKETRHYYVWLTKHASRHDCPTVWTIPLKLALEGHQAIADISGTSAPSRKRLQTISATFKSSDRDCSFSTVPAPLPFLCPYQHKHRMLLTSHHHDDEPHGQGAGDFQHGKLKVVIYEGVVYRLIEKGELKVIEVHPGDGSVLVSQGIQAHFYTHYLVLGDKIEERTYSLKSLPLGRQKGKYSIENLIKTANRFFSLNHEWEKRGLREMTPCWNKDVIAVVEPLSTSLLEERTVDGLGKFSAFSNGRVRIVFTDRTALDMFCNFSNRLSLKQGPELHTLLPGAEVVVPAMAAANTVFGASNARILLPSGNYVTVDINCPGVYRRYIQLAQDWANWVNCSPAERQEFHKLFLSVDSLQKAAELELKKIVCFNYIVDHTLNVPKHLTQNLPEDSRQLPYPQGPVKASQTFHPVESANEHLTTDTRMHYTDPTVSSQRQWSPIAGHSQQKSLRRPMHQKEDFSVGGFHNVREVLLQNSNLINEIDSFLEKTRKS